MTKHSTFLANDVWSGWLECRGYNPVKGFLPGEYAVRVYDGHEFEPVCRAREHEWGSHYTTHYRYKWRAAMALITATALINSQEG